MAQPVLIQGSRGLIPITIKTRGISLNPRLRRVVFSSIRSHLGRFCNRVRAALVWIEDTNGPREGSGMRCRIEAALRDGGRVSVSAEAASEYAAVSRCAARARVHLQRRYAKRRRLKRRARVAS